MNKLLINFARSHHIFELAENQIALSLSIPLPVHPQPIGELRVGDVSVDW